MTDTGIYECFKQWKNDDDWLPMKTLSSEPIKVAILDSGISHYHLPLANYGLTGRSFVEDFEGSQNDKHWHCPMVGHGTRVAHLILGMTKDVHLIIAKIQSGPRMGDINVEAATKVSSFPINAVHFFQLLISTRRSTGRRKKVLMLFA
jgi:hypothetical protein